MHSQLKLTFFFCLFHPFLIPIQLIRILSFHFHSLFLFCCWFKFVEKSDSNKFINSKVYLFCLLEKKISFRNNFSFILSMKWQQQQQKDEKVGRKAKIRKWYCFYDCRGCYVHSNGKNQKKKKNYSMNAMRQTVISISAFFPFSFVKELKNERKRKNENLWCFLFF